MRRTIRELARFVEAIALGHVLLAAAACSSSNVCGLGKCESDCSFDAGPVVCATGLSCKNVHNLACTTSNPDCNGWYCVTPPDGGA